MSDKLQLIERLLAKAESTTPEEAEALTAAAEKLMIRYGIDEAMLDAKRGDSTPAQEIVEHSITYQGVHAVGLRLMAWQVVQELPVKMLRRGYRGTETIYLVGFESDVQRAERLLQSLHLQAFAAMRAWWRSYERKIYLGHYERRMAKREFIASFGEGVRERLYVETSEAVAETVGSELVLFDRAEKVDGWIHEMYPKLGRTRKTRGSVHGRREGRAAGRVARTGESAVSSTSRQSLSS